MLVSNLSVDSLGIKLSEQWRPLAKFFWKSDSLTLHPGSCGHICGPVGEWNWMQSFPHFPTLLFKWHRVLDVVGGRHEKHCYALATIFNIVHHPFNTWTADSRELYFIGWDSRKTKHQWFLFPKLCKNSPMECSTALASTCLFLLTLGVFIFSVKKSILIHPHKKQTCLWDGNVLSKFLSIPSWGLAHRSLSINIC